MSDASRHAAKLRERLTNGTEDKIGKALADLLENPLVTGTIGRAFDARERATQAQELALSALNLPTAADIERLTRRLRSVSQRLEGIEDGVHRLNRALSDGSIDTRLSVIEDQLKALSGKLATAGNAPGSREAAATRKAAATPEASATRKASSARTASATRKVSSARKASATRKAAATREAFSTRKAPGSTRKVSGSASSRSTARPPRAKKTA